ncbi:SusC/RagA family TonB-linked outer membrane protein [Chryseobacterium salivictor]|uniref:TonB-dependent receptor SusC n=1 Tax=Chryseobacterium salivictor TaxID=2547600 RepID=A0A4P6ZFQ1_9FLAO|nr:SusC/RagA family TonB-linked outer membrane protein [Chryseobacterium salivictor]QBO58387.1 TonB-dependent receptor SusC [Chryseobacterium salivictor]
MNKIIAFIGLVACSSVYAQYTVAGEVLDDKTLKPLSGITVSAKHSAAASVTDSHGKFILSLSSPETVITVSGKNYEASATEVSLPLTEPLKILMISGVQNIEGIQLTTGYQKIPKERATGSFSTIDNKLLNQQVTTNIMDRLDAVGNGLLVSRGIDGEPQLSVRGLSTIRGPKDPLIVVDDFPYEGDLSNINPEIVENITILKDASAASIWGARAANGVIVITTKKGKFSQPLSADFSMTTTLSGKPDLNYIRQMSSSDFIDVEKSLFTKGFYDSDISSPLHPVLTPVVDLLNKEKKGLLTPSQANEMIDRLRSADIRDQYRTYMYQPMENHQYALNLSGGSSIMNWTSALGYDDNTGNLGQSYKRINFRLSNNWKVSDRITMAMGAYFTRINQKSGKNGYGSISMNGNWRVPYLRFADDIGNPVVMPYVYNQDYKNSLGVTGLLDWNYYPLTDWMNSKSDTDNTELILNGSVKYKIITGLDAEVKYQYQTGQDHTETLNNEKSYYARNYINNFAQQNGNSITFIVPKGGILDAYHLTSVVHNIRGQLNYNRIWNRHNLTAIAGSETRENQSNIENERYYGYNPLNRSSGAVDFTKTYPLLMTGGSDYIFRGESMRSKNIRFASLFANAAYTYDSRYTVSGSIRRDGSNLFGLKTNDQWNPFWSVGAAWNITNENFFHSRWINTLKLRSSYGFSGNIDPSMAAVTTIIYDSSNSVYTGTGTARIDQFYNPDLRWETLAVTNIGVDFTLWKGRVTGSAEWFRKKGSNLFGNAPLDYTTGITSMLMNVAGIKGDGWDVQINTQNIKGGSFQWNSLLNFSRYRDKVTEYYNPNTFASAFVSSSGKAVPIAGITGLPVYSVFAYRWAGLDPATGDPRGYLNGEISKNYTAMTGSDKGIEDLKYFGSALPTTYGSFINTLSFKNISMDVGITYKFGYWFRRSSISYTNLINSRSGHSDYAQRWQHPGDEQHTNIPSNLYTANSSRDLFYLGSEVLVEKGDHIRLQYINLNFEPNASWMNIPLKSLVFFGSVNNIGVIWSANKQRLDPDYAFGSESLKPTVTYSFGLRVKF